MKKIVYVSTYHSYFWKVPVTKFIMLLNEGSRTGTVSLNTYGHAMKRNPKGFYKGESKTGHLRSFFVSKSGNVKYFDITDWNKEDFKAALDEVLKWWAST